MPGAIWSVAEFDLDGRPTRLSLELAALTFELAAAAGREASTLVLGASTAESATQLGVQGPTVLSAELPAAANGMVAVMAAALASLVRERQPSFVLFGATQDGKDLAGLLAALLDWPVLVNASGVGWVDGAPMVEMSTFGGRLATRSAPTCDYALLIVRPGSHSAEPAARPGTVETVRPAAGPALPEVSLVERVAEAGAVASIEEARVIVAAGRGVGGPGGVAIVRDLAEALGGVVGASRAPVDAGWIPYSQQIGQTGKAVKPALYVAVGISGAMQHKVGMQTSGTIVAINRDPDAPITEFADLVVVGDLFEVLPRLAAAIRARAAEGSPRRVL